MVLDIKFMTELLVKHSFKLFWLFRVLHGATEIQKASSAKVLLKVLFLVLLVVLSHTLRHQTSRVFHKIRHGKRLYVCYVFSHFTDLIDLVCQAPVSNISNGDRVFKYFGDVCLSRGKCDIQGSCYRRLGARRRSRSRGRCDRRALIMESVRVFLIVIILDGLSSRSA